MVMIRFGLSLGLGLGLSGSQGGVHNWCKSQSYFCNYRRPDFSTDIFAF